MCIIGLDAVSYTHLDVYKRQDQRQCIQAKSNLFEQIIVCNKKNKTYKMKLKETMNDYTIDKNEVISIKRSNININNPDSNDNNNLNNNDYLAKYKQSPLDNLLHKRGDVFLSLIHI